MTIVWLSVLICAVVLELLVIFYVARGSHKRFRFVLVLCAIQVLVAIADSFFSKLFGVRPWLYPRVYWAGDLIAHAAICLLIISLIGQGLDPRPDRRKLTALLAVAVLCFGLFSAYTFQEPKNLNRWMTSVSRNLSFGEEILNLLLWTILIQRRDSDYLLLMVSAGIGIQVTGEAIGHTLRLYTHNRAAMWVPDLLVQMAELLCLCIWVWAFRSTRIKELTLARPVANPVSRTPAV